MNVYQLFSACRWCIVAGYLALSWLCAVNTGCANIVPPMGGPKDSLPPFLMLSRPADSSTKFTGKKISLEFNEYVQLDRLTEQLIVSPTPQSPPLVSAKLRNINITLTDSLESNTTYAFDFGDAIRDVNENNVLKQFSYVFTTGDQLDFHTFSGTVVLAESGKKDSTLVVLLYANLDDSAVVKEKPRYVTRLNNQGRFTFRYLPKGTFRVYALKDESGSRKYLSEKQLFAFADAPVAINDSTLPLTLYAYAEQDEKKGTDATPARLPGARSVSQEKQDKQLRFSHNLENGELDLLQPLVFDFRPAPLRQFDSARLSFTDEQYNPIPTYRIALDSSRTRLSLTHQWKENTAYHIIVQRECLTDTAGRQLAGTDTLDFRTKKKEAYGSVQLRFRNLDLTQKPVLQWVQNDQVVFAQPLSNNQFNAPLFKPGDYALRILFDVNGNGKWDPGQFWINRKQPERVLAVERKVTVKPNWDNEIDITL